MLNTQRVKFALMLTFFISTTQAETPNKSALIEECLIRLGSGDNGAIGQLYNLIKTDVFAYALSKTGNKSDAEDVMQETFVNIYKHSTQYVPKGKPMAWIITIELNLIRRLFQIARRTISIEDRVFPESGFEQKIINDAFLAEMLKKLSEEEREIVSLHIVSGLKHREIASIINKPLSTVLSKYNRAIKKLKEIIKEV